MNESDFFKTLVAVDSNLEINQDGPCFGYRTNWKIPDGEVELVLEDVTAILLDSITPKVHEHQGVNIKYELYTKEALRARFPDSFN